MNTTGTYDDFEEKDFPFLSSDGMKRSPFLVPDNYFDELPAKVEMKIRNLEELKALSPALANADKENPFTVPENYFKQLEESITGKTTRQHEEGIISLLKYFDRHKNTVLWMAASVTLLIALFFYSSQTVLMNNRAMLVSSEELSGSVFLQDIDEATLMDELEESSNAEALFTEQTIEDYLIENGINETILIFEL